MPYKILVGRAALKDQKKIIRAQLREKVDALVAILKVNPWQYPPPYEPLIGDMEGFYSRRINYQHRLVYQVDEENHEVKIERMWSHYE